MKKYKIMERLKYIPLLLIIGFLVACSSGDEPVIPSDKDLDSYERDEPSKPYVGISLSRAEQEIVGNMTDFSFAALQKIASEKEDNIVFSPFSISSVLSMMANGASGQTLEEYKSFLKTDDIASLNALNKKLLQQLPNLDNNVRFNSANAVFYENISIQDGFKNALKENFNADFYSDGRTQMNQWCDKNTWGMVKELNMPDSPLAVVNITAFMGRWKDSFDENKTKYGALFTTEKGIVQNAYMMHNQFLYMRYYETEIFQSVSVGYGNNAYQFVAILPKSNLTIDNLLDQLTINDYYELTNHYMEANVDFKMPRFKIGSDVPVKSALQSLGLTNAFIESADYNKISDVNYTWNILQKATIELNENGSRAVATTGMQGDFHFAPPASLDLNRPFIFLIHELSTKAILFMGVVRSM